MWQPFLSFLTRPRALEILAFVVLYKFADQLYQSLTRPFLIDMGYNADQRGIALATIGVAGTVVGSFIGGWVTTLAGLGHSLWIFGFLQLFSNVGYYLLSILDEPNPAAMYAATGFELLTSGMGTGAFSVLLAPADREAILGDAVRALLEPLRAAASHWQVRSPGSWSMRPAGRSSSCPRSSLEFRDS